MTVRSVSTAPLRAAYHAHGAELLAFARRALPEERDAEDAVQETFLRAWRARERFDPAVAEVRSWLFAILRNVIVDHHRRRGRRRFEPLSETSSGAHDDRRIDSMLAAWQVEECLSRLSAPHREVIVTVKLRNRSIEQAAADLGVPAGTVRSRLYYALQALRLHLQELGWEVTL